MKRANNPYVFLFRKMRTYAPSKKMLIFMLTFNIISKLIWLIEPRIFWKIVNVLQVQGVSWRPTIRWYIIWLVWVTLFWWMFHWISRVWEERIKFDVWEAYSLDMFHKVTSLPMQRQNDNHSWETIDKINKWVYAIKTFTWDNHMYWNTVVFSIWSIIALFSLRWKAWMIMLIFWVIIFMIVYRFDLILVPLIKLENKKEHRVMSTLFDFLSNIKTLITLRFEGKAKEVLHEKIQNILPTYIKYSVLNEWKRFSMDMLVSLTIWIILWWYIFEQSIMGWTILIWTFTMLFQYSKKMNSALSNFTWQYSWIVTKKADMEAIQDIEDEYALLPKTYHVNVWNKRDKIHIQDLHFTYKKWSNISTLSDIGLTLAKWKNIALVGESGSGKSTLMSLLRWLYDVDNVVLRIWENQFDDLHPLAHITSLIPQEPEIFENTIKYNICMWLDVSDEEILRLAKIAHFDSVIDELPSWLDTDIKERWVNLSWWQKQRLALCRWLLVSRWSDVVLLDEPTSSVDSVNERSIYESILKEFNNKCIVSSIHKLHLLELFDYVYILDWWKIVQQWSFTELLESEWLFTTMWEKYQIQ